jgi:hypothetical protein
MTATQYMPALEKANAVRLARAALKRAVALGERSAAETILEPAPEAQRMVIFDLLRAQRHWGDGRCRRLLQSVGIPERKLLCELTERQRQMLAAHLRVNGSDR